MDDDRRRFLYGAGVALTTGLAGCSAGSDGQADTVTESDESTSSDEEEESESDTSGEKSADVGASVAVAAEWNAMRMRLFDAVALGEAGRSGAGAAVAGDVFARFENAGGEWGAHEQLEKTNEDNYETFEENLGDLRSELESGNVGEAREAAVAASDNLLAAIRGRADTPVANAFILQALGTRARNAGLLAAAGNNEAAASVAGAVLATFEQSPAHDPVESAAPEQYESFERALKEINEAASAGKPEAAREAGENALTAAVEGSYEMAPEAAVAAGELATMQARAFDATAISNLGGPGQGLAHAATLTTYRARVYDAALLAEAGNSDAAAAMVQQVFADFEGASAHDPLEAANHDAYEAFEGGLESLKSAIENGESVTESLSTVDSNLLKGVSALAPGEGATLLEAAFFRARFGDALEAYHRGDGETAATIAEGLFERFEADEAGFHETLEHTDESLYHEFEEEHLASLIEAFRAGEDDAVSTHYEGVQSALLSFETQFTATAGVSVAEAVFMDARAFDSAAVATMGSTTRAGSVVSASFEHFESGAGGFHEALEHADHETYETFETKLGAVRSAANDGGDVQAAASAFHAQATAAAYAVVAAGSGSLDGLPGSAATDTYEAFENAHVHELVEEADHETYESFEGAMESFISAVKGDGDASAAISTFADHATKAQFAVVGAPSKAPSVKGGSGGHDHGESDGHEESGGHSEVKGGPNVVPEGEIPDDATVVDMKAVSYAPAEVTVSTGDTVAFVHAGGEPHTVTAYEDKLPEGASYWASGGFDSEKAARDGWESENRGGIASGQAYVHTFETAGEHPYVCIPHEMAGMEGTVIVEE
jgi:plastocyanin